MIGGYKNLGFSILFLFQFAKKQRRRVRKPINYKKGLKMTRFGLDRILSGSRFRMLGPATLNARSENIFFLVKGACSRVCAEDLTA